MYRKFRSYLINSSVIALLACFSITPLSAVSYAEECTPPAGQTGVHQPVGADAQMYHYDCATGLWISSHFTYNPATSAITASDPTIYTYNPSTGLYDFSVWIYSVPQSNYVSVSKSISQPPAGASIVGAPAPAPAEPSISNTGSGSNNTIQNNGSSGQQSISNTGPGSNNDIQAGKVNSFVTTNDSLQTIANLLNQTANTGDAIVLSNTSAGGASTGNAQDIANIVNLLQSTSSALGSGNVVTFVKNIDGDVNGDLLFDPSMLGMVQATDTQLAANKNLTVNNSVSQAINNDITINAASGNANVSQNTSAGDATSGSAKAIANVINLINSAIASGKSFIGTININGNLNGDILLPPNLIDQLIAANVPQVTITGTGPSSNNTVNNLNTNQTNINNTNNQGINNNVYATATSGNADVSQNTQAGSATTGGAKNSITAFNLTGSNVIGKNAMLVFVNVTGKWVGFIVNTPPGTTAAALGGGIVSQTGPGSANSISNNTQNSANIDSTTNQTINNNISVNARSGDASVTYNTKAGSAHTGDAKTAVNLLNVQNSSLALTDWFGILFINVFGTWSGSFGVNTSAGDPIIMSQGVASGNNPAVFNFIPGGLGGGKKNLLNVAYSGGQNPGSAEQNSSAVVASTSSSGDPPPKSTKPLASPDNNSNWLLVASSIGLFALYLFLSRAGSSLTGSDPNAAIHN